MVQEHAEEVAEKFGNSEFEITNGLLEAKLPSVKEGYDSNTLQIVTKWDCCFVHVMRSSALFKR